MVVVRLGLAVNTLLGPEGTSTPHVVGVVCVFGSNPHLARYRTLVGVGRVDGRCGGWSLFENCTVDASIFVVKLPRANGGCLGTRSR
jgi:hypothetical protein